MVPRGDGVLNAGHRTSQTTSVTGSLFRPSVLPSFPRLLHRELGLSTRNFIPHRVRAWVKEPGFWEESGSEAMREGCSGQPFAQGTFARAWDVETLAAEMEIDWVKKGKGHAQPRSGLCDLVSVFDSVTLGLTLGLTLGVGPVGVYRQGKEKVVVVVAR
ncbi:hypothetical protein N7481_004318 [Penicillium waksmanii]|uniref:uncharacterized protein n=1 Tax=Penicillium waksmanii TaxID=69791 RepID=UPI0025475247|nr:uncharacterized protein N7481_004318 [Penicillium waksmanii]KAJ5989108.1 hypothetical protein N7481_004318 [Penicillium waksmanii]